MSKPELRKRLAALSFSEKIKILEKLRERSRAIAASRTRLRSPETGAPKPAPLKISCDKACSRQLSVKGAESARCDRSFVTCQLRRRHIDVKQLPAIRMLTCVAGRPCKIRQLTPTDTIGNDHQESHKDRSLERRASARVVIDQY
jgi:hypothetical protein